MRGKTPLGPRCPCRTSKASLGATSGAEGEALTAFFLGGDFFFFMPLREQPMVNKPHFFFRPYLSLGGTGSLGMGLTGEWFVECKKVQPVVLLMVGRNPNTNYYWHICIYIKPVWIMGSTANLNWLAGFLVAIDSMMSKQKKIDSRVTCSRCEVTAGSFHPNAWGSMIARILSFLSPTVDGRNPALVDR